MDSSYFVHRSKVRLSQNLHTEALSDANKVIELNPSSHLGYELKYKALRIAHRHDDASEAFTVMFYKMNNAHDPWIQQLGQQHRRQYEVESAIRKVIEAQLKKAPLRLINTSTGRLCDQGVRIDAFIESTEYEELTSLGMHGSLQTELIKETVAKYFSWVMLSHRWGAKEPLLHDIQGRDIYDLDPVGTMVKLQKFCKVAHVAGHRWAWSDTCCIDQ
ncbi:uncharacterized protein BJ212DRAFT_1580111 [Suillus subaureus]|uniref:Heterokaryon incompatibility domain-containing protein n=1 Tax=Suillus subaureus TaxID=48587 RepID=A0A9P7E0I0_9AGAM|nr:uncharacterized protein BJ212DRAFT_1580111 [Suillus subaureus]KAG1807961.1 hypothetical protein BJ212DRAFT_1580111 [Suillus subaureus]